MRATFITAALAAIAVAAPHQHKRDLVVVVETATDVVWVTQIVTVTAGDLPAYTTSVIASLTSSVVTYTTTAASSASADATDVKQNHYHDGAGNRHAPWQTYMSSAWHTSRADPTSTVAAPVYSSPAPIVPTTSIVPPVPTTTSALPQIPTTSIVPPVLTTLPVVSASPVAPTTYQAPSSSKASQVESKPTDYSQIVVAHHNLHRRNHSAPDIVWDATLANTASKIAASCNYAHNVDMDRDSIGGYGQNIAAGVDGGNVSAIITEMFYNGEVGWYDNLYGQANPSMTDFEHWGHFSQIVWHDTAKVGCATQHCNTLQNVPDNVPPYFTVCNYQAPGNMGGEYTQVGASLKLPTAHWDYFS